MSYKLPVYQDRKAISLRSGVLGQKYGNFIFGLSVPAFLAFAGISGRRVLPSHVQYVAFAFLKVAYRADVATFVV